MTTVSDVSDTAPLAGNDRSEPANAASRAASEY